MRSQGARIRHIRQSLGMTQDRWAIFLSDEDDTLTRGAVANWEYDKGIKLENLERIAAKTGVSLDWLSRGIGHIGPAPERASVERVALPSRRGAEPTHRIGDVPNLNIHAGMGNGGLIEAYSEQDGGGHVASDHTDGFWTFPPMVKARLPNLKNVHAIPVVGDSMEPTLTSGSVVFVDTTHRLPSPEDIYAIDYGDGLMIKRVKLVPRDETVRIISDNPMYGEDVIRREDLRVYSRVVGFFRWRS